MEKLFNSTALSGMVLGISVSESEDLQRLGLLEIHFQMALAEIARAVLVGYGTLAYGGYLRATGYTAFLSREVERYGRRDAPFKVYVAWSEHRILTLEYLQQQANALGLYGQVIYLDQQGNPIDPRQGRNNEALSAPDEREIQSSLTSMRRRIVKDTQGRVLLGGKRRGFHGVMPGVLEEAILAVEAGLPIYLVGGFGGAATDVARALDIDTEGWLPPFPGEPPDERLTRGIESLVKAADRTGRKSLENGLSPAENKLLSMTNRPGEVASLIARGLARVACGGPTVSPAK